MLVHYIYANSIFIDKILHKLYNVIVIITTLLRLQVEEVNTLDKGYDS